MILFPKNPIFVFVLQCDPKHKQQIKQAEKKKEEKRTGRLKRSRGTRKERRIPQVKVQRVKSKLTSKLTTVASHNLLLSFIPVIVIFVVALFILVYCRRKCLLERATEAEVGQDPANVPEWVMLPRLLMHQYYMPSKET